MVCYHYPYAIIWNYLALFLKSIYSSLRQFFENVIKCFKWSCLPETWSVTMLIDAIQLDWDARIQMETIQEQMLSSLP